MIEFWRHEHFKRYKVHIGLVAGVLFLGMLHVTRGMMSQRVQPDENADQQTAPVIEVQPVAPRILDKAAYDQKLRQLAHVDEPDAIEESSADVSDQKQKGDAMVDDTTVEASKDGVPSWDGTSVASASAAEGPAAPEKSDLWPVKAAYPNVDAILPFKRIVAYYGNFYSKGMGVLGEYPEDVMLEKLDKEVQRWEKADPTTPVMPAIDYIAVTAQLNPGQDGKYRARMPFKEIDKAIALAEKVDGIVILEVQVGLASIMGEVRALETYLSMPQVHLAIDPEFSMKTGARPGTVVGTVDAADVNAAAEYLAQLVRDHELPPKVLVVHRYTQRMVTNADKITPLPEVQIVMDMDGWGPAPKKYSTYNAWINPEPVQFTGFKLFYKNDIMREGSVLLTPAEVLELTPQPSFIQYQ